MFADIASLYKPQTARFKKNTMTIQRYFHIDKSILFIIVHKI